MINPNHESQLPLIPEEDEGLEDEEYFDETYEKIVPDDMLNDFLEECEQQLNELKANGELPWDHLEDIY